jgi:uncharacterized membrane protein YeaQ/YmgE (transglycosylase-associated protein family)
MGIIWIIVIGFIAGLIARWLSPGPNNPSGFILTTVLGIVGAFLATWIGQAIGWYSAAQGAGFIGATVGAVLVLFIWNRLVSRQRHSRPRRQITFLTAEIYGCAGVFARVRYCTAIAST